jgi:hypothetical protein
MGEVVESDEENPMWRNRNQHAEALETNTLGFLQIRPDSMEYKTANGMVQSKRKVHLIEDYIRWIHRTFNPAKVVIQYPGDVMFNIIFLHPVEGIEIRDALDSLAESTREVYPESEGDVEVGMQMPYTFTLERWAAKDPESTSLGPVKAEDF